MPEQKKQHNTRYSTQALDKVAQQAQKNLLDNVTCDLLTPLTAIRSLAETLQDGMVKDEATQHIYYGKIISETKCLEQKISDLMELSDLQNGRAQFNKVSVRSSDICRPVFEGYMARYADTDTTLDVNELDLSDIPFVQTDAQKMVRLINILLDKTVALAGCRGTVKIKGEVGSQELTFCIQGSGLGISEKDLNHIFDRFYKKNAGCSPIGNGLEFAIANQIAKGLDEKLWAESTEGEGTSFFFTISLS